MIWIMSEAYTIFFEGLQSDIKSCSSICSSLRQFQGDTYLEPCQTPMTELHAKSTPASFTPLQGWKRVSKMWGNTNTGMNILLPTLFSNRMTLKIEPFHWPKPLDNKLSQCCHAYQQLIFFYLVFFFLSGLSFTNIHESQDCRERGRAFH